MVLSNPKPRFVSIPISKPAIEKWKLDPVVFEELNRSASSSSAFQNVNLMQDYSVEVGFFVGPNWNEEETETETNGERKAENDNDNDNANRNPKPTVKKSIEPDASWFERTMEEVILECGPESPRTANWPPPEIRVLFPGADGEGEGEIRNSAGNGNGNDNTEEKDGFKDEAFAKLKTGGEEAMQAFELNRAIVIVNLRKAISLVSFAREFLETETEEVEPAGAN